MTIAQVSGWHDFQHYNKRRPPWIKLHRKLLENYDFACLPIASKALAPLVWLLAAESDDGTLSIEIEYLQFRLGWSEADLRAGLNPLIDRGFINVASAMLAPCNQNHLPETETETEGEAEGEIPSAGGEVSVSGDSRRAAA